MNSLEKAQLFAESRVLNALNKNICGQRRYIDTGKRKKGKFDVKDKVDPLTLTYLLTHCWGVGKNRVSSLRKEIFNSAIENGMNQETASILMQPIISEDQDKVLTVIDSQNVAPNANLFVRRNDSRNQSISALDGGLHYPPV